MKKEIKKGYGKLLDAWTPPVDSGKPIGCVATTFTFSPVFFEEECLSRFLQIESDPEQDGPIYLIEREEKLSSLSCASVLVDQHHCRGARSLRWDLMPFRMMGAYLHAKVSILNWTELIRIIVTSANLTEDGYRKNQEVFAVLDYYPDCRSSVQCLKETTSFLRKVVAYVDSGYSEPSTPVKRWTNFLNKIEKQASSWCKNKTLRPSKDIYLQTIFSGPGYPSVFKTLENIWSKNLPPSRACITSPFFDPPEAENKAAKEIWNILKQKGKAKVTYKITAEEIPEEEGLFLNAPKSLLAGEPNNRNAVSTKFKRILEEVDDIKAFRPLHAKSIWLENSRWRSYMIGSSNFTSAGTGLSKRPNFEANLNFMVRRNNKKAWKNIHSGQIQGIKINLENNIQWKPRKDENEEEAEKLEILPAFFNKAVYAGCKNNKTVIELYFNGKPPEEWFVFSEFDHSKIYSKKQWLEASMRDKVVLSFEGCQNPDDPMDPNKIWVREDPATAKLIDKQQLKTKPFFLKSPSELFSTDEAIAITYAQNHYYELLATTIPARTYGIAAKEIDEASFIAESYDMQNSLRNSWYQVDVRWGHSSFKNVAYIYTYKVYNQMVVDGGLK